MDQNTLYSSLASYAFLFAIFILINQVMKKSSKDTEKVILITVMISAVFLILTYVFLLLIKTEYTPPLVSVGSIDAWIGFSGSILGGIITVLALVFTIKNQKELRDDESKMQEKRLREEMAHNLMPIISIEPILAENSRYSQTVPANDELWLHFKISNLSVNHARNIRIKLVYFLPSGITDKEGIDFSNDVMISGPIINLLPSNSSNDFLLKFASPAYEEKYGLTFSALNNYTIFKIEATLSDVHNFMEHTFVSTVNGFVSENVIDPILFENDEKGEIVTEIYNKFRFRPISFKTDIK